MKILFASILSLAFSLSLLAQTDTCLLHSEIGISFPPVSGELERDFAKIHLDSLGIKRMRFGENWSFREPTPGDFNWGPLDDRMAWLSDNGYEVLLTIQSNGPEWACGIQNSRSCVYNDNSEFKAYVDALLSRYPNQIDKIQFGNEWQSDFWYIGNAQQFVEANNVLYQSVQEFSPSTKVVLGGFTTISLRFLAGCNGFVDSFYDDEGVLYDSAFLANNCTVPEFLQVEARIDSVLKLAKYDILDIHLYDDVEQWDEYYSNFSDTITKPIIVSEFGGPNMNLEPYTEAYQADRVYEYIKKLDSLGISEMYFFKLVEGTANPAHSTSGLIEGSSLEPKLAYDVVKAFEACTSFTMDYEDGKALTYYPNPATGRITIELDNTKDGDLKLEVYSVTGDLVHVEGGINQDIYSFETDKLSPGVYFIQLKASNEMIGYGKLVIK